jgi:hypothetical protein
MGGLSLQRLPFLLTSLFSAVWLLNRRTTLQMQKRIQEKINFTARFSAISPKNSGYKLIFFWTNTLEIRFYSSYSTKSLPSQKKVGEKSDLPQHRGGGGGSTGKGKLSRRCVHPSSEPSSSSGPSGTRRRHRCRTVQPTSRRTPDLESRELLWS